MPDKVCVWLLLFEKFNLGRVLKKTIYGTENKTNVFARKISEFLKSRIYIKFLKNRTYVLDIKKGVFVKEKIISSLQGEKSL